MEMAAAVSIPQEFARRFGFALIHAVFHAFAELCSAIGSALADSLPGFSFDLVGLCASYLICGVASEGAKPNLLFDIGSYGTEDGHFRSHCFGIAVSPFNSTVWVSDGYGVQAFTDEGHFLFRVGIMSGDEIQSTQAGVRLFVC